MRLEISFSRPDPCRRLDKTCCLDFAFDDWDMPVPRMGERIWLKGLDELEDDQEDPEWRVTDVQWEPDADDYVDDPRCPDAPHCYVKAELVGVNPDSEEDKLAFNDWYYSQQKNEWPEAAEVATRDKHATVDTKQLVALIEDMAERVRCGDCFGGSIEFDYTQSNEVDKYTVMGAYRTGNREGQGGMRLIREGIDFTKMTFLAKLGDELSADVQAERKQDGRG